MTYFDPQPHTPQEPAEFQPTLTERWALCWPLVWVMERLLGFILHSRRHEVIETPLEEIYRTQQDKSPAANNPWAVNRHSRRFWARHQHRADFPLERRWHPFVALISKQRARTLSWPQIRALQISLMGVSRVKIFKIIRDQGLALSEALESALGRAVLRTSGQGTRQTPLGLTFAHGTPD